jgi:hypothetical protein
MASASGGFWLRRGYAGRQLGASSRPIVAGYGSPPASIFNKFCAVEAVPAVGLRVLVGSHDLRRPRVFGSVVTGLDTEGSDLDLLVEPTDTTTLFTLARLEHQAGELLGVRVSVLTPKFLSSRFRDRVLRQAEPL